MFDEPTRPSDRCQTFEARGGKKHKRAQKKHQHTAVEKLVRLRADFITVRERTVNDAIGQTAERHSRIHHAKDALITPIAGRIQRAFCFSRRIDGILAVFAALKLQSFFLIRMIVVFLGC